MCDKFFRLEESSDLLFSFACRARRNKHDPQAEHVNHAREYPREGASSDTWSCLFLRAQCSENMFCLSSERKKRKISPQPLTIRSIWRRIRAQRSKTRLVSSSGMEWCCCQNLLEVDTTFVHGCMLTS